MKLTILSGKDTRIIKLFPTFFKDEIRVFRGKRVITTPIDKARTLSKDLVSSPHSFILEDDEKIIYDSSTENRNGSRSVNWDPRGAGKAWHKTHMASSSQPRKHKKLNFRIPFEN